MIVALRNGDESSKRFFDKSPKCRTFSLFLWANRCNPQMMLRVNYLLSNSFLFLLFSNRKIPKWLSGNCNIRFSGDPIVSHLLETLLKR
jgi:hypothetical protein